MTDLIRLTDAAPELGVTAAMLRQFANRVPDKIGAVKMTGKRIWLIDVDKSRDYIAERRAVTGPGRGRPLGAPNKPKEAK